MPQSGPLLSGTNQLQARIQGGKGQVTFAAVMRGLTNAHATKSHLKAYRAPNHLLGSTGSSIGSLLALLHDLHLVPAALLRGCCALRSTPLHSVGWHSFQVTPGFRAGAGNSAK